MTKSPGFHASLTIAALLALISGNANAKNTFAGANVAPVVENVLAS
jgi:hypothetical protein